MKPYFSNYIKALALVFVFALPGCGTLFSAGSDTATVSIVSTPSGLEYTAKNKSGFETSKGTTPSNLQVSKDDTLTIEYKNSDGSVSGVKEVSGRKLNANALSLDILYLILFFPIYAITPEVFIIGAIHASLPLTVDAVSGNLYIANDELISIP